MGRIIEIDFFEAPGRREVERAREAVEERTASGRARPAGAAPPLDLATLKGRRWVTRPRPHVDRIASAWLIKRFVDPEAEFVFASPDQIPGDAIPFDMAAWDFGHHGRTARSRLPAPHRAPHRKRASGRYSHEADIKDEFARDRPADDLALRALLSAIKDDHEAWRGDGPVRASTHRRRARIRAAHDMGNRSLLLTEQSRLSGGR